MSNKNYNMFWFCHDDDDNFFHPNGGAYIHTILSSLFLGGGVGGGGGGGVMDFCVMIQIILIPQTPPQGEGRGDSESSYFLWSYRKAEQHPPPPKLFLLLNFYHIIWNIQFRFLHLDGIEYHFVKKCCDIYVSPMYIYICA